MNRVHSWQSIQRRIRQKIDDHTWAPGDLIPGEVELAGQFGCARATVNRALRELAQTGIIDRKRKAGTRVAVQRTRKATTDIPVIRKQVEQQGKTYRFELVNKRQVRAPMRVARKMRLPDQGKILHLRTVHYAGDTPFVYEERWINSETVPAILQLDFTQTSANEWLVAQVPFSAGQLKVSACLANRTVASALRIMPQDAVLYSERQTWLETRSVTLAGMYYPASFRMEFDF